MATIRFLSKLEELISDLVEKTLEPCKAALKDAKLETKEFPDSRADFIITLGKGF